ARAGESAEGKHEETSRHLIELQRSSIKTQPGGARGRRPQCCRLRIVIGSANLAPGGPERPPGWRFGMCVPGCQEAVRHALSRRGFFKGALAASFGATAVAPEIAGAAPARSFTSVVDLTHTMSPDFPTFFGVPGIEMDKKFDLKKDGFNLYWWRIIEHAGTHLDAPIHFSEGGITAEKIPAATLVAPLAVIDVTAQATRNRD